MPGAGFGRGGEAGEIAVRTGEQAGGGIAGPGDEAEQDDEENRLKRSGNTEAAKLGAVVDEQVAIAKQCRRRGQNLRHLIPAPKLQRHAPKRAADNPSIKELPSP